MSEQKRQKWICRVLINNDKSESIKICGIRHKKVYTDIRTYLRSPKSAYYQNRSSISKRSSGVTGKNPANSRPATISEVLAEESCRSYVDFCVRRRGETTAII